MPYHRPLRLGTRASALARWQAEWVAEALRREARQEVELVLISTHGDQDQRQPIGTMGGQGVFTKELQRALRAREIDLAVHSLKDLPTDPVEGLLLTAVPEREEVGDALLTRGAGSSASLPPGAKVGTGSLRRRAQLLHRRPDLRMDDLRGNIDTRLRKLDEGQYDAIVLAQAGLRRLGLAERISEPLPLDVMLPAVGQGALGLETRADDLAAQGTLSLLDHEPSHLAVLAERALLAALRGGCLAPVGAWARVVAGELVLDAAVLSADGQTRLAARDQAEATREAATALGQRVAQRLLADGAAELIQASRGA